LKRNIAKFKQLNKLINLATASLFIYRSLSFVSLFIIVFHLISLLLLLPDFIWESWKPIKNSMDW
jgi:hypothetical protein